MKWIPKSRSLKKKVKEKVKDKVGTKKKGKTCERRKLGLDFKIQKL